MSYLEAGVTQGTIKSISTQNTSALICDLEPGSYYTFMIRASNPTGFSEVSTITISTEQPDPPVPPLPEVINTTSSTIGVALFPVVVTNTLYHYGYLVSIHDVTEKAKRALSSSNISCPGVNEIPGTVIRNFTQAEIPYRISFIIGDGKQYGDFENKPLTENNKYDIYYVITSYFEDICKYTYVKTTNPVTVVPAAVVLPETTESSSTNVVLIIGIIILVIIIIVGIAILIFCWWRRRQADQNYKPYYNESDEHFDLKVYEKIDNYNPQNYWNSIYSLRESRYIVAGREYIPDGHRAMNGSVGVANGQPPLLFQDEYSNLPHGRLSAFNVAKRRDNELKNRFSHLLPYDHSRVILDPDVNSDSDYINASFIKGYKHQRAYIAAQSPFDEDTVLDFWRMIYQYEVRVIVMLSNIVEDNIVKCTQFWPDSGRAMYGKFMLDLVDVQEYADYTLRSIRVRTSNDRDWQMVYLFDYNSWPEHGVPTDAIPLLEMRRKINVYQNKHTAPIIVHCGTGVSRSGVYIAVDSLLQQYEQEGMISVFSFVKRMRKDRPAMVRTAKQYTFIYEAIFEAMVAGDTLTGPGDLKEMYHYLTKKNPTTHHSYLHGQFHCLEEYTRKLYPSACSHAYFPANVNKNRFCEVVPPDLFRPVLTTPGGIGRTDYINAVYLDSHRKSCHYVITQTPLHTTVIDFWKLVYDHDIYTIVMMEPMTFEDDTCAEYWPEDHMKQYEPFFVETADVYQQENITIRNFKLTSMSHPKDTRHIRQFQFNAWTDTEFVPKSKSMLLDVMDLVEDWQRVNNNDSTPILVHCKDGATHSGLFIAVSLLCEKVLDEGEVDVFHTVKHLKRRRTQIVDMLVCKLSVICMYSD